MAHFTFNVTLIQPVAKALALNSWKLHHVFFKDHKVENGAEYFDKLVAHFLLGGSIKDQKSVHKLSINVSKLVNF